MKSYKLLIVATAYVIISGCAGYQMTGTQAGMLTGAVVGAGAGQLIGKDTEATLIGAGAGAAAGGVWGHEEGKKRSGAQTYGYPTRY